MAFRVRVEIEDFDNDGTASVERTIDTERWPDLIDVFLDALRGAGFTIADSDVEIARPRDAEIDDWYELVPHDSEKSKAEYPLCEKYGAPIVDGLLKDTTYTYDWVQSLPDDFPARFWTVMGPVTAGAEFIYAGDVEDTLFALENGHPHRRWNG